MKKLNVFRLGLLFAGCFLGAGYVSGQELRQYFVVYGAKGYLGLLAAVAILYIFGVLCLRMAQRTGLTGADELVVPWRAPWLHALVMVLESLFLFALVTIMCAGVGALLEQIFAIPHWLGSLLFAALVLACALAGLQSVVSAFSVSVRFQAGFTCGIWLNRTLSASSCLLWGMAAQISSEVKARIGEMRRTMPLRMWYMAV